MNKYLKISVGIVGIIAFSQYALAGEYIYRFKDSTGKYIYTDSLPSSEKGSYTVLSSKTGTIKKVVAKELTPEEVVTKEQTDATNKKLIQQNEIQKRKDTALLSTYANVGDIDKMKEYELGQIDQVIKSGVDVTANLKDKLSQIENEQKSSPGSKKLQDDHDKVESDLKSASDNLNSNKDLYAQRNQKYNDDKTRYLEILQQMSNNKNANATTDASTDTSNNTTSKTN